MKILSAEEIRQADAHTILHKPVPSIELMEIAASRCAEWMLNQAFFKSDFPVTVFCGPGNNGGDGLAIARMLIEKNKTVEIFILNINGKFSEDFKINEERLKQKKISTRYLTTDDHAFDLAAETIVIDSIFGTGLNKPVEGFAAEVIHTLNSSHCRVISIDIPSGLFCEDNTGNKKDAIVKAWHTLTFQVPRLSFMFPGNAPFLGGFTVLDIGLDEEFIRSLPSKNFFITRETARDVYKPRTKFSHKGDYGHALLMAGAYGKMGAAVLAARACLRVGCGLLTCYIPSCGYAIMQTALPEAMVQMDQNKEFIAAIPKLDVYKAIGAGPGIGTEPETQNVLKLLIQNTPAPLVLDADALNILSENKTWLSFLPAGSILTPHPKEFERLTGESLSDYDRYMLAKNFSVKYGIYLVLKGAHTLIACPDGAAYFNSSGNPGLAKGGCGDVLTGMLTGLLAQGYSSRDACILGVYLHGLAADILAHHMAIESILARDISDAIGEAMLSLYPNNS